MRSYLLNTLTKKEEIDRIIRDTIDEVLVLRFGRCTDAVCPQHDEILAKSVRGVSKFATAALVDVDSEEVQVYVKNDAGYSHNNLYDDIEKDKRRKGKEKTKVSFSFRTADHTKWVGAFHVKKDFIDVVEEVYRGAMKGKMIVQCPVPPERIPK